MRHIASRIGLALGITLGVLLLALAVLAVYFSRIRVADIKAQAQHVAALRILYKENYTPVDEQQFVSFNLAENNLRLNEIQLLATHNSYKKLGSPIAKLLISIGDRAEARALKYENNPLTDQLNHGVRSFELDLRCRKGDFEVIHAPLADNSSTVPNFDLALEEVLLWSEHNPGHIPILILLELKGDWMFLDPALSDFGERELAALDRLIRETLDRKLLTPGDITAPGETLNMAVREKGWPLLSETLGKIIVILHPGSYTDMYVALDPGFTRMAMFPAASDRDTDNTHASFIVHNDPHVETINRLVSANYIVRTRLDSNLMVSKARFENGLASGAQILTTDFGPNHNFAHTEYVAYPDRRFTVIANNYLVSQ